MVTSFNWWLLTDGASALFGSRNLSWWALSGSDGSFSKFFFFIVVPVVAAIEGIRMLTAVIANTWVKNFENIPMYQRVACKVLYLYVAAGYLVIFLLSIRVYLSFG